MTMMPEWLADESLQQFFAATAAAGGQARAVGGCVRDFLLGRVGADVDIASTLTPEQTMVLAAAQGWKAIPTGLAHGTVTVVLPSRVVEVTTLRRDVATDGRHATIAFTQDWQEDAARRDFTINAMSMDVQGKVFDYFDGQADLVTQRVAFIGDATTRIKEDGLRILRYFRFLATHGKPPADAAALVAITANKTMLQQLSGERIANEMRKLLAAENPAYVLRLMVEHGVAPLVFGRSIEPSRMIRLHMFEMQADYQASVWARVICMLPNGHPGLVPGSGGSTDSLLSAGLSKLHGWIPAQGRDDTPEGDSAITDKLEAIDWIISRWKLSRYEVKQLQQLAQLPAFSAAAPRHVHTRILRIDGAPVYLDWLLMQAAAQPGINIAPWVQLAREFTPPIFPITAKDLIAQGMEEGKALGDALGAMERKWEESDYMLGREELLAD